MEKLIWAFGSQVLYLHAVVGQGWSYVPVSEVTTLPEAISQGEINQVLEHTCCITCALYTNIIDIY